MNMENQKNTSGVSIANLDGDEVLNGLMPELLALEADDLVAIGVDVRSVTATVLGALPEIRKYSAAIVKAEPKLDDAALDKLERVAYALNVANAHYLAAGQPTNDLLAMVDEGVALRDRLLQDAKTLASRGLIEGSRLENVQLGVGYKNLSADLLILAKVLKDGWATIQGKCATEWAELERAARLGQQVIAVVGLREKGAGTSSASDVRARAFTLVVKLYDEFRRVISFLRWQADDADRVAPSLYANRGGRRRTDVAEPAVQTPPAVPAATASASTPAGDSGSRATGASSSDGSVDENGPFMN